MKVMPMFLCLALPAVASWSHAQEKTIGALGRIFLHNDGTRTETQKNGIGTQITEKTYSKNNILISERFFNTDQQGRLRNGVIYDGKKNPLGSMQYHYDKATDQIIGERLFDRLGRPIRDLWYPGALKDQRFAKRFVAFTYNPDQPDSKPAVDTKNVKPVRPIQNNLEKFESGVDENLLAAKVPEAKPGPATPPGANSQTSGKPAPKAKPGPATPPGANSSTSGKPAPVPPAKPPANGEGAPKAGRRSFLPQKRPAT